MLLDITHIHKISLNYNVFQIFYVKYDFELPLAKHCELLLLFLLLNTSCLQNLLKMFVHTTKKSDRGLLKYRINVYIYNTNIDLNNFD